MGDFEQLLFETSECNVFKIPPRQTAAGHKAEDWQGHHIWTGICKVKAKGDICEVRLEDAITGEPFAVCPINSKDTSHKVVEPVTDSSRYFVLRIEDGKGHHAFIGMGFEERSHAFDFNVAISDFKSQVKRQEDVSKGSAIIVASDTDYSLKAGEKIKVDLKGKNKVESKAPSDFSRAMGISAPPSSGGGISIPKPGAGFIPPPPGGKRAAFKAQQQAAAAAATTAPAPAPAAPVAAPAAPKVVDDLDSLFS